jgi:hypothetical protein
MRADDVCIVLGCGTIRMMLRSANLEDRLRCSFMRSAAGNNFSIGGLRSPQIFDTPDGGPGGIIRNP